MDAELATLEENETWIVVDLPANVTLGASGCTRLKGVRIAQLNGTRQD